MIRFHTPSLRGFSIATSPAPHRSFLSNKATLGGKAAGEVVVTADDVKQFMEEFTKNKRQRMA